MARTTHCRILPVKLLAVIAVVCLASCSSYIAPLDPNRTRSWLPFLIEGRTTKEEVLSRLGTPVNEYEGGIIVSYILRENRNSQLQVADLVTGQDWNPEIYNLVLVFGPMEILERYSIVRVR
jgi:hypothetical protein